MSISYCLWTITFLFALLPVNYRLCAIDLCTNSITENKPLIVAVLVKQEIQYYTRGFLDCGHLLLCSARTTPPVF